MTYMQSLLRCLCVAIMCATSFASDVIDVAAPGTTVDGQVVLLAIDDHALPLRHNVCLYISKPTLRAEPVLKPERDNKNAPDQLGAFFYGTVIKDGDKFRMWYYGARQAGGRWKLASQPCYAESADGIHWQKPALGQVEINGSLKNNAIALVDIDTAGVTVLKDDAEPDPARRYKMVLQYMPRDNPTLKSAVSADGLQWAKGIDLPQREFREQASFFKHNGLFIVCGHTPSTDETGSPRGRQGFAWVSPDFNDWPIEEAKSFFLPEPPPASGWRWDQKFDQVHLGVGAASFGNVAVGLYGLWHQRGWGEGGTSCDLGLVVSNDGIHFREPIAGHRFIRAEDNSLPAVPGKQFPNLLCQANGILNVDDETRIYYGRWRNSEWPLEGDGKNYYSDIGLATMPRDRWGAVGLAPKATEGSVWSAPIKLPAGQCAISLNADGADGTRVEVADETFKLQPDFSGEKSGKCAAAGLNSAVRWPAGDLTRLVGKTIRLRVLLKKDSDEPRLYAIYVTASNPH